MDQETSTTSTTPSSTQDQNAFGRYTGVFIFLIITIFYFIKKPKVTPEEPEPQSYMSLGVYFLTVVLTQLFWNAYVLSSTCGGNFNSYIGQAALYTILPWTFFFGIVIVLLISAPSFKSAFSDIVGYYLVQSQANNIFSTLLVGQGSPELEKQVSSSIDETKSEKVEGSGVTEKEIELTEIDPFNPDPNVAAGSIISPLTMDSTNAPNSMAEQVYEIYEKKIKAKQQNTDAEGAGVNNDNEKPASDLITQICGNVGVLINQLLPSNFNNFWSTFQQSSPPLFKQKFRTDNEYTKKFKNALFDLVVFRDNVGEGFWYVYTGILVSCIVQFQLASFNCKAK